MTIIRVLVPSHLEQWFMERFPKAIKKRTFKSDKLDYVEYFILEFSIFDLETLGHYNLFWKYDNWPRQFWD